MRRAPPGRRLARQALLAPRAHGGSLGALLPAVCAHLRPFPYPYGTLALRILGKLGGRNRHFISRPMALPAAPPGAAAFERGEPALALACAWSAGDAGASDSGGGDAAAAVNMSDDDAAEGAPAGAGGGSATAAAASGGVVDDDNDEVARRKRSSSRWWLRRSG